MASRLVPGTQVMSDLLTIREKGILFTLLEPQCKVSSFSFYSFQTNICEIHLNNNLPKVYIYKHYTVK